MTCLCFARMSWVYLWVHHLANNKWQQNIDGIMSSKNIQHSFNNQHLHFIQQRSNIDHRIASRAILPAKLTFDNMVCFWCFAGFLMGGFGGFGVTGGAHRLWSHRSYKATTPLRIILMLCFSLSGQNTLYDWGRMICNYYIYYWTGLIPYPLFYFSTSSPQYVITEFIISIQRRTPIRTTQTVGSSSRTSAG